jgi:hypothetical protein
MQKLHLRMQEDTDGEGNSTYTHHMKDALFMMPTPRVLANVVDQLDSIDMADKDTKGDLYEYMLGKIASAGQNGQFRTPRHIIKLMVEMSAPTPKDVICDPACGTAGFLIAASEHLVGHHSDAIYKSETSRKKFNSGTFHGYDFDSTMLRIGSMNMLLHGVETIWQKMEYIRNQGNIAVHGKKSPPPAMALDMIRELYHVLYWTGGTYLRKGAEKLDGVTYDESLIPPANAGPVVPLEKLELPGRNPPTNRALYFSSQNRTLFCVKLLLGELSALGQSLVSNSG